MIRVLKPIVAGLALAYLVTAFVDKPAPVHFQPENPYAAKQEEVAEPQADTVMDKNILKLGSPLSVAPEVSSTNPLAPLENMTDPVAANATSVEIGQGNATSSIRGEVGNATAAP